MLKREVEGEASGKLRRHKNPSVSAERFKRQIEFILEADKLKKVKRRTTLLDVSRQENSAEHSWHIAFYTIILPAGTPGKSMAFEKARLLRACGLLMTVPTTYGVMSATLLMMRLQKVI